MNKKLALLLVAALAIVVVVLILARVLPSDVDQLARQPLVVQLQWEPSAQFLGFYVAKQNGDYAAEGLDVVFLHGGPNVDPIANIKNGNAKIGLSTADQVLRWNDRNTQHRLRAFGTVFGRSLAVFMAHADLGVKEPTDLAGKAVGVFPSYDTESLLWLLLEEASLQRSSVTQINFPSFKNFERRDVQVYGAYIINEPVLARLRGIDVTILDPVASDIHFYSDTLIAREDYYSEHKTVIEGFLRASVRGWRLAEEDTKKAIGFMKAEVGNVFGTGEPWQHQENSAHEVVRYLRTGRENLFVMNADIWNSMERSLRSLGILTRPGLTTDTCDFSLAARVVEDN